MKKQFNKGPKKVALVKKALSSVFLYTSTCCKGTASNNREGQEQHQETLGSWRCGTCNRPCSVTRKLNKTEEVTSAS
jgi:hypothetical protein